MVIFFVVLAVVVKITIVFLGGIGGGFTCFCDWKVGRKLVTVGSHWEGAVDRRGERASFVMLLKNICCEVVFIG